MALGIAAGAFAQNYAQAKGLRSRLDSEKQQQEAADIRLRREREFDAAQKELADMHKNFLNPAFDFVANKPYEQPQGGIAGPDAARPAVDPYADSARVKAYYDRITPVLERQAFASGKDVLGVREQVNTLRKNQFVERVGNAINLIEAGDAAGFKQLQAVYDMYEDGRKITGGRFNEDGTVVLQYEQGGQAGERTLSREQLASYGRMALNPADAAKLRYQIVESEKDRKFRRDERVAGQDFARDERVAGQEYKTGEREAGEKFTVTRDEATRLFQGTQGRLDRENRVTVAGMQIAADAPAREARTRNNETQDQLEAQKYFNNRFQVNASFAPKPESEVKALIGSQKEAYTRDLARWEQATKLSRAADSFYALNRGVPLATIAAATEKINKGQLEIFRDNQAERRFVNYNGKRIYLD